MVDITTKNPEDAQGAKLKTNTESIENRQGSDHSPWTKFISATADSS